ncbi:lasso peptide biosynthesis PqqD family chaperone [Halobacillus rhizosphaerae]|uniref:lasso peptide biosynthesis PqqD family chaperone n=1 Tax=Halobacillus rhizosphaerae TaxID=3064889 RepID=UPI00398B638F
MSENLLADQTVRQKEGMIVSDMGGERVMLSIEDGKYFNLGELGGEIWDLLAEPTPPENLINTLVDSYDIDRPTCEKEVHAFLEQLHKEHLIVIDG